MPHDIIDNRHDKLLDRIQRILPGCESVNFAVGYFFLSGLQAIANQLGNAKELRLLIGNVSDGETVAPMDPTPQVETLVCTLVRLMEQGQLHVRAYTQGRLHAKAYVLDYGPVCEEPPLPSE